MITSIHTFWSLNGIAARGLRLAVKLFIKRKALNQVMVCAALYGMVELFGVKGTINLINKQRTVEKNANRKGKTHGGVS